MSSTDHSSGPGWTLDEERRLGDYLQRVFDEGGPSRTAEDQDAEQIMKATLDGWPSYAPGDDE